MKCWPGSFFFLDLFHFRSSKSCLCKVFLLEVMTTDQDASFSNHCSKKTIETRIISFQKWKDFLTFPVLGRQQYVYVRNWESHNA